MAARDGATGEAERDAGKGEEIGEIAMRGFPNLEINEEGKIQVIIFSNQSP